MNANQPKSNFKTETVSKNDIPIALSSFRGSDVICDTAEPQRMSRDEQDFDIPVTSGYSFVVNYLG